jgi:aldose 1-epimerase
MDWGNLVDMSSSPIEEPAPVIEELAPVIEEPAPVIEEPVPVIEEPAPVIEEPAPVIEEPAPVVEEPAPVIEEPVTEGTKMSISKAEFGEMPDGRKVDIYTLTNANGASMKVLNLGGIVYELNVPDKDGKFGNVSANLQTVKEYLEDSPGFGTLIGRYGNRIANGKYTIDGVEYDHGTDGKPLLHGGNNGFSKAIWDVEELKGDDFVGLTLKLTSDEAHQGFPGTVECVVTYKFNNRNEWEIDYTATTDKATPINLTQHTYFNLSAFQNGTILDELMMINADKFIPVDETLVPTGEIATVEGTVMDFRTPTAIGERLEQVVVGGNNPTGYDHCWVLDKGDTPNGMTLCAKAVDPTTGRTMEVWTTEPGVQFYTGNFMDGKLTSGDVTFVKNTAYCLETQHYPDSPNQPDFPNTILRPGETYRTTTVYKFGVQ